MAQNAPVLYTGTPKTTTHKPREYNRPGPTLFQTCPALAQLSIEMQEKSAKSRRDGLARLRAAKEARR